MISAESPLLLVGCGRMGRALLSGWLKKGMHPQDVVVIDPNTESLRKEFSDSDLRIYRNAITLPSAIKPAALFFAIKPQGMDEALVDYRRILTPDRLVLSIVAGKTVSRIQTVCQGSYPIIRAMPNTPATIGHGVTVAYAGPKVTQAHKTFATTLLEAVSEIFWVEDERHIDAATALSGSGPAYVFLFAESLVKAGISCGLPEDLAKLLALLTLRGSCELALESDFSLTQLREHVTSKGGTTEAAMRYFTENNYFEKLVIKAVQQAHQRAKELSES